MKKLTSALFALALALCAGQALALNVVNHTTHKIDTRHIADEDMDGFVLTVDGKPVVSGELYILMSQVHEPLSTILEIASQAPVFATTTSKVEFSFSDLCPGSAFEKMIGIEVTLKGKTKMFCLANYEDGKIYAMFPYGGF